MRSRNLAGIFDRVSERSGKPRDAANWIITELLSYCKNAGIGEDDVVVDPEKFAKLIGLVDKKTVSRNVGKTVFGEILKNDVDPEQYVAEHGLGMVSDTSGLEVMVREAVAENAKSVLEYQNGNAKVVSFLMGQVMRKSKGKADPQVVGELLLKVLAEQ